MRTAYPPRRELINRKGYNLYTTPVFLTSFWINGAIACAEFLAWIVFRRLIKAVYEPRTYIPLREQQAAPLGAHLFKPLLNIWKSECCSCRSLRADV